MPQPNLVPVRPSSSRMTHSSGVSDGWSESVSLPLMANVIIFSSSEAEVTVPPRGVKFPLWRQPMNAPAQAGLPALPLKDPKLFREQCYIDGQWVGADAKKTLAVINPANGQALGTVPDIEIGRAHV